MNSKRALKQSLFGIFALLAIPLSLAWDGPKAQATPSSSPTLAHLGVWEQVPMPSDGAYQVAFLESGLEGWAFAPKLIAHWDGDSWTNYPTPKEYSGAIGVVLSQDNAWAIQAQGILHWDGHQWKITSAPIGYDDFLFDLDFVSPTQGWAVGVEDKQGFHVGIILKWDGKQWIRRKILDAGVFVAIDMISPRDGWLVDSVNHMFRWNGKEWIIYDMPNLSGYFSAISMADSDNGWMAGYDGKGPGGQGILWRWDGTQWSEFQRTRLGLNSIAMVSPDFGWAVGGDWGVGGSLLLHWDGQAWTEYPISTNNPLTFVASNGTDDGWIFAGREDNPPYDQVQVFRYRLTPSATATLPPTASVVPSATATPIPPTVPPTSVPITIPLQPSKTSPNISSGALIAALIVLLIIAALFLSRQRKA